MKSGMPPHPTDAQQWAILAGLIISLATIWKLLWMPLKNLARWMITRAVIGTLVRSPDEIRRVLREGALKEEVRMIDDTSHRADANHDSLEAILEAQKAQGIAMNAIRKAQERIQSAQARLDLMPETLERLSGTVQYIGQEIGIVRGKLEERERWDGVDRRKGGEENT